MSDREKLVELLGDDVCPAPCCEECSLECSEDACIRYMKQSMADHLMSNGVTVQKWIPVSERLPTEEDADEYETVYAISKGSYPKQWHWAKVAELHDHFTHWMPLPPEPPRECE